MNRFFSLTLGMFAASFLLVPAVQAVPVTWTINNAVFDSDGVGGLTNGNNTLTGTFDFDADTGLYSNIAMTSAWALGTVLLTRPYNNSDSHGLDATYFNDVVNTHHLVIRFQSQLTNAGGTVALSSGYESDSTSGWYTRYLFAGATVTAVPAPPVNVAISILPTPGVGPRLHAHHDGSPSSPAGLNDVIRVRVLGSLMSVGDPVDFTANEIAPATLRFGPDQGAIRPGSTPMFNVDLDSDGINDARFEFLTGDTGIACLDTAATLTGQTNTGLPFEGVASFTTNCDAQCH